MTKPTFRGWVWVGLGSIVIGGFGCTNGTGHARQRQPGFQADASIVAPMAFAGLNERPFALELAPGEAVERPSDEEPATEKQNPDELEPSDEVAPMQVPPLEEEIPADDGPSQQVIPSEETLPTEDVAPVEETLPTEDVAPVEETLPTEDVAPVEGTRTTEDSAPTDESAPIDDPSLRTTTRFDPATYVPPVEANYVFVTTAKVDGNIGGLEAADAFCQAEASVAGLRGSYRAWLSDSTQDAIDRFVDVRGFRRVDGLAVADRLQDLVEGRMWHPIDRDAKGELVDDGDAVYTATRFDGRYAGQSCNNWSSSSGFLPNVVTGYTFGTTNMWTNGGQGSCALTRHLYCFGTDANVVLTPERAVAAKAFVTSREWAPGGGIASADALCQNEASAAGESGRFRAMLPTVGTSLAERFSPTRVWVTADGIEIASSRGGFFDGTPLLTPPNVTLSGEYLANYGYWTGASGGSEIATPESTCDNWTSSSGTGNAGTLNTVKSAARFGYAQSCAATWFRLVCLGD